MPFLGLNDFPKMLRNKILRVHSTGHKFVTPFYKQARGFPYHNFCPCKQCFRLSDYLGYFQNIIPKILNSKGIFPDFLHYIL
jgi:hypothetical protein